MAENLWNVLAKLWFSSNQKTKFKSEAYSSALSALLYNPPTWCIHQCVWKGAWFMAFFVLFLWKVHETATSLRNGIWRKLNLGPGAMITHVGSGINSFTPFVVGVVFLWWQPRTLAIVTNTVIIRSECILLVEWVPLKNIFIFICVCMACFYV